jgi:alpha-D-ribose 1-methylphosphonate 5-triphosphate synthase subunit PhnI
MYVAVKGGETAIRNSQSLLAELRRGDPGVAELSIAQIREQLRLAVDRVMTEGSVYDRELAALAIKQAQGDLVEAAFLLRAYRTTLPRFAASLPVRTERMALRRRISAIFKDLPGGQVLGPTTDYTHRLLDFALAAEAPPPPPAARADAPAELHPRRDARLRQPWRQPDRSGHQGRRSPIRPRGTCGCKPWRAATRGSCSASAIPPSAATAAAIRSSASCAPAR